MMNIYHKYCNYSIILLNLILFLLLYTVWYIDISVLFLAFIFNIYIIFYVYFENKYYSKRYTIDYYNNFFLDCIKCKFLLPYESLKNYLSRSVVFISDSYDHTKYNIKKSISLQFIISIIFIMNIIDFNMIYFYTASVMYLFCWTYLHYIISAMIIYELYIMVNNYMIIHRDINILSRTMSEHINVIVADYYKDNKIDNNGVLFIKYMKEAYKYVYNKDIILKGL